MTRHGLSGLPRAVILALGLSTIVYGLPFGPITFAQAAENYSTVILQDAPAAYWRLGEVPGTTTAADTSGHSNTLTYQSSVTLGMAGAVIGDANTAAQFNGTSAYASRTSAVLSATTNWSLEAWIYPTTLPQFGAVLYNGIDDSSHGGYGFEIANSSGASGSDIVAALGSAGVADSGYTLPAANRWYHVVMTRDTSTIRFYVNGQQTPTTSTKAPATPGADSSLGGGLTGTGTLTAPFAGIIDEAAMYGTALAQGRVVAHYQEGANVQTAFGKWIQQSPSTVPSARADASAAYDTSHSKVVMFGGKNSSGSALSETWTYDGTNWTKLSPSASPSARWGAAMAYDAATATTILFGGYTGSKWLSDTWSWNGTTWSQLSPSTSPGVRAFTSAAYRAADSTVVVFGGQSAKSTFLNDTWTWNGTTWSKKSPTTSPSVRYLAPAAYDTATTNVVLFGGNSGSAALGDTWSWNGSNWSQSTGSPSPSSRQAAALSFDAASNALVLFGGVNGSTYQNDTWAWDGSTWSQQLQSTAATARSDAVNVYQGAAGSSLLYGGTNGTVQSDTWWWTTPPSAPQNVQATRGNAQATVTWNAPASTGGAAISSYRVTPYSGTTAGSATSVTGTSSTITGLTNGTTYTFQVVPINSVGNGPGANSNSVTPATTPGAPTNVSATAGNAQATVTWTAPASNGGSAITGYTVTSSPGSFTASTTGATSATVTGLTNGTAYTFTVTATNSVGSGPASTPSNSVTPATVPGAPTNVSATAGNAQATVTWTAPSSNGGAAISSYTVTPYIGSTAQTATTITGTPPATNATINGLTNGTTYTFQVAATNSSGRGPAGISNAVTPLGPPGAPTNVTATGGNAQASVTWTAPSNNGGSAVTSYTVTPYIGTTAQSPSTVTGSPPATQTTVTNLTNGTTYTFQVTATNSTGAGPAGTSNPVTPATVPGPPTNVTATAGNAQATVSWAAPTSNGGSAITGYTVTPYIGTSAQGATNVGASSTTTTITGLTNGTTYIFQVTANNSLGSSTAGTSNAVTPATVPGAPTNVTATAGNASATVSWTAPSNNGGAAISSYTVTPYIGSTPQTPVTVNAPATSTTVTGLTNGTAYTFQVAATNSAGTGPAGVTSTSVTPMTVPAAPTGVTAAAGNAQATVSWTAPTDNGGSAITGYSVTPYIGTTAQTPTTVGASVTNTTITGLANGTTYTFQVEATNSVGTGAAGTSNAVTPAAPPTAPQNVTATAGNAQATVNWQAPASNGGAAISNYTVTPYIGTTAQPGWTVSGTTTSFVATGLINGTTYTFQVAAINSAGTSPVGTSNAVTPATTPSAPQTVTASTGNQQATVTWTAPASTGGSSITSYTITVYQGSTEIGTPVTTNGPTTSQVMTGLTNGQNYYFSVYASNSVGPGPTANSNSVEVGQPQPPTGVTATAGSNQVTVSWTASVTNGATMTAYVVQAYAAGVAKNASATDGGTTSVTITGLQGGVAYTFQVYGESNDGNTALSTMSGSVTPRGSATTYASTVIGDGAGIFYRLGEPSGPVANDSSGNGNLGSYLNSPTLGQPGALIGDPGTSINVKIGGFVPQSFGIVRLPSSLNLPTGNSPRSLEAWIQTGSSGGVIGYGTTTLRESFFVHVDSSSVTVVSNGDDHVFLAPYAIANGGWHHLVVTYDGTSLTVYLDGQSLGSQTFGGALNTVVDGNGLVIGNQFWNYNSANDQFQGNLDDLAVYPAALTAAQVANHFNLSNNTRPTVPTVTATAGSNQATVSWTASTGSPGAPTTQYLVQAFIGSQAVNAIGTNGTATSTTISGLQGGTTYTFQVTPENDFGFGPSGVSASVTPTGNATTYASTVIGDHPAFYYRLSEASGPVAADSSGNSHHAEYLYSPTFGATGAIPGDSDTGIAVAYGGGFIPGAGGVVRYRWGTAGLPTGNAARSVELWFKTTMPNSQLGGLIGYGTGSPRQAFQLQTTADNQLTLYTNSDNKTFTTPYTIDNGGWHQVVVTYDGTTATMYLDGQSLGGQAFGGALNTAVDGNGLVIANDFYNYGGGVNYQFAGSVDDVSLYPTALTSAQVLAHFNASNNGRPTSPVVSATAGANQASISWTASTTSPGAPVTQYLVTAFNGSQARNAVAVNGTTTNAIISGLPQGTYTFQVVPTNDFGNGPAGISQPTTISGLSTTYASTVLGDAPSFYYRLSEPSGAVAADSSGNGRNGEYLVSPTLGVAGALANDSDPAAGFTQINGPIPHSGGMVRYRWSTAGLPTGNSPRTLEAWINSSSPLAGSGLRVQGVVGYGTNSTRQAFQLRVVGDNQIVLTANGDDRYFSAPRAFVNGGWHQIVVTYDGTTAIAYLDGQSLGGQTFSAPLNTVVDGNGLIIANDFWDTNEGWDQFIGNLDDLAVYPTALTPTQVSAHFAASGNGQPGAPTVMATAGANQASVSWTAPASNGGATITQYLVRAMNGSQAQYSESLAGTATSATISGLPSGVPFTFQVSASNNFGTGPAGVSNSVTPTGASSTYASTVLADGPAYWYRLGDPSGSVAADSSGNGRNGEYLYSPGLSQPSSLPNDSDTSANFSINNGPVPHSNGMVRYRWSTAGLPTGNGARSVEAWVNTTYTTANGQPVTQGIVGYGTNATRQGFDLHLTGDNEIVLVVNGDDRTWFAPYPIANGGWHHIVVTYDGTTATAYLDGQSLGGQTFAAALNTVVDSNGLIIADNVWTTGDGYQQFVGNLDEVAVYPSALSASQVAAHFAASSNMRPTAPVITSVTPGSNAVTVDWSASQASVGASVTSYLVTASLNGTAQNAMAVSGSTTSTTMTGLGGSTGYTFQVTPSNNFGTGQASAVSGSVTPTGPGSTYATSIIASNPALYYRLGDPSGIMAADSSGHGRNGVYLNGPTLNAQGAIQGDSDSGITVATPCCYYFPPPGGQVRYRWSSGLPTGNSPRSIEAWVKTTANATQAVAGYGTNVGDEAFQIRIVGSNQVQVVASGDDHAVTAPAGVVLNDGNWHQVVVTYDGTVLTAYIDGQSIGTASFSNTLNTVVDLNGFYVAGDFWSQGDQFNGSLDEVALFPAVLSGAQVLAHYQAAGYGLGVPAAPTGVTATGGTNQATVSWTAPSNTGTSAISSYTITPHVGNTIRTPVQVAGSQTSATVANLGGSITYTFTVFASNNSGNSPASAPSAAVTVTGAPYPYSSTILGDGPAGYWRLGESPGVPAADASGNGNTGSYTGGFTEGQAGPIVGDPNTAVLFDGNTGHVSVPSSASLDITNGLSVEAWVKFTAAGTSQLLVNKGDGGTAGASAYELGFVPGTGFVFDTFIGNTMTRAASSSGVVASQWYHVVGTRTANGTVLLYVNGELVGAANDGGGQLNNVNAPVGLAGSGLGTGSNLQPLSGTLGEVAIYPTALYGAQVANHWQQGGYRAAAPTGVSATGGANQATVSWTAPTGGPALAGYLITPQIGTSLRTPTYVAATATSATVTNLSAATYSFTVAPINAYGIGASSAASAAVTVSGTSYPYAATVIGNGPAGYWRLGESSGTLAVDASGNGNAGTYAGGISLAQSGAIQRDPDGGVALDGSSGRVLVPNSPSVSLTGALSLETWVNLGSVTNTQSIVDKGDGATAQHSAYQLSYVAGQGFSFTTYIGTTTASAAQSNAPAKVGTWYHVVGVRTSAGALTLYVNGAQVATASDYGSALNAVDSPLTIGASGAGNGSHFYPLFGSADEAAVYPIALTSQQVTSDWDYGGFVPAAPTSVVARIDASNQATVTWLPPSYSGTSAITSYIVTPVVETRAESPVTVDSGSNSANVPNLMAGLSYTFNVAAVNGSGPGFTATTNSVTPSTPASPNLGDHLEILAQNTSLPFGVFAASGDIIQTGAQWTIEGWMWGFSSNADTGGNSAWGLLAEQHCQDAGAAPLCPSPGPPVAGIDMQTGTNPLGSSFVWPGGSYPIPSSGFGYPSAINPTHYALDYDGTTVRGFINGNLLFSTAASGLGNLTGFPGIADQQNMQTGSFDEFRISTVARYTSNFTPPTTKFPDHDVNAEVLYHFDDYGPRQVLYMPIYTYTNYHHSDQIPDYLGGAVGFLDSGFQPAVGLYRWAGSPQITGGFPMAYGVFELPQGQSVTSADVRSPSESNFTCNWGSFPVNCSTGEFYHTFTDVLIPGRGVPLSFQRTYSSLHATTAGSLGNGWTDSYNMSLSIDPSTGNATVNEEAWSSVTFTPGPSNTFQAPARVFATLVKNGDGTYTFTRKNQVHYVFDSTGRLVKEVDRNGYATVLSYNGSGQLATITDPAARALTLGYTGSFLTSLSDNAGRSVSFQYDGNGNLIQATDVGGGTSKFTYDSNHLMLTMKDAKCSADSTCNGVINTFDAGGRVLTQTDPMNRKTTFNYRGSTTAITDPNGNETDETYMDGLLMVRTVGANSSTPVTWRYSYDPNTLTLLSVMDPNGNVTSMSYDAIGNLLNIVDPLGRTQRMTYDALNDPLTVTDPLGTQTTYAYDGNGNVSSVATPLAGSGQTASLSFGYDPAHPGDVLSMKDENGKTWTFAYDQYGDRISTGDPKGDTQTSVYDTIGRLTSSVSPNGNALGTPASFTSSYTYDAFGDLTQSTDAVGDTVSYLYDANGNLTRLTDGNHNVTNYAYDFDNELTTVTRADSTTLQYTYDGNGNLTKEQDGLQHPVSFGYDALNRMTSTTDNLQRTTSYGYDLLGNLTTVTDPLGRVATYSYDLDKELLSASFSDGVTPAVGMTYDADGQRLTMTDATGTSHYNYDSLHRLTQSIDGSGTAVGYAYDLVGHLTSITYPGGAHVVSRGYDDAGRLTSVTDWLGRGSTTIGYDADSNPTNVSYPNGVVQTTSYDNADRLMGITDVSGSNTILALSYARDATNQLTAENSTTYGYNGLRQLTSAGNSTYSFDAADRLTQHAINGGTTSNLVYDAANQLQSLTTLNGSNQVQQYTYAFNADGDRISRTDSSNTVTNYGYDQADRLTSIGSNVQYTYDGSGLRVSKNVGGQSEAFVWDHADGLPLILQDGSTSYVTGLGGLPLEQISASGSALYYQQDQLGSTRAMTDGSGNVVTTYAYDAYGSVTSSSGAVTNPFQFAGGYADSESGLLYLRARYYDPASGSFLTKDPLSAVEPYGYAAGSPLNLVDPTGLSPSPVGWLEDQLQAAPVRAFGLADSIFFGPEQALNDGNCLGFAIDTALFFAPEFKGAEEVLADDGFLRLIGREKGPLTGTPNSIYTQINAEGKAVQNSIYDSEGNLIGHVDFSRHGDALSGHGHVFPPGRPELGHGKGALHIPHNQLPSAWGSLPSGVSPRTPIGQ